MPNVSFALNTCNLSTHPKIVWKFSVCKALQIALDSFCTVGGGIYNYFWCFLQQVSDSGRFCFKDWNVAPKPYWFAYFRYDQIELGNIISFTAFWRHILWANLHEKQVRGSCSGWWLCQSSVPEGLRNQSDTIAQLANEKYPHYTPLACAV